MSTNEFSRSEVYEDPPPPYETLQPVLKQPVSYGATPDFTNVATTPFPLACLSGLESLRELDQLNIEMEPIEYCSCSCESFYSYNVKDTFDQNLFTISPVNSTCTSYDMQLLDSFGNPVVLFQRCRECCSGLRIEATHMHGALLGTVQLEAGFLKSAYIVGDGNGQTIFKVKRSRFQFFPKDVDFSIMSADGPQEVGKITWLWSGWMSARHLYKIVFPKDLLVEMKMALLAAWYMMEEDYQDSHRNRST